MGHGTLSQSDRIMTFVSVTTACLTTPGQPPASGSLQVAHAPGASITATMAIGMRWSLARAHLRYV